MSMQPSIKSLKAIASTTTHLCSQQKHGSKKASMTLTILQ